MKKVLIFIILFIINNVCLSQTSGVITYGLKMSEIKKSDKIQRNKSKIFELVREEINNIQTVLKFSNEKSIFNEVENMEIDDNMKGIRNIARLTFKIKSKYYIDLTNRSVIREHEFDGINYHITSEINDLNWKLINNSKKVNNYNCYKAVTTDSFKDRNGNVVNERVIAWYCPEISNSFGPLNYAGLPGVILELEIGNKIYYASSIKLNNKLIKIDTPKKGKTILENDYKKLIEGSINKFKDSR